MALEDEIIVLREQITHLYHELAQKQHQLDLYQEFFRRVSDLVGVFGTKSPW